MNDPDEFGHIDMPAVDLRHELVLLDRVELDAELLREPLNVIVPNAAPVRSLRRDFLRREVAEHGDVRVVGAVAVVEDPDALVLLGLRTDAPTPAKRLPPANPAFKLSADFAPILLTQ